MREHWSRRRRSAIRVVKNIIIMTIVTLALLYRHNQSARRSSAVAKRVSRNLVVLFGQRQCKRSRNGRKALAYSVAQS